jgi:hypothetical protein
VDFSGVDEVENLQEHEHVEDKSEMTRIMFSFVISCHIIIVTTDSVKSATANSTSDHSVVPFVLWMDLINRLIIKGIHLFRNELFP